MFKNRFNVYREEEGGGEGGAGGAGGEANWRDSLPESVRGWDEFKDAETADAGFERLAHMRTKFGTGLFAPGEDASEKDWTDFYGKLSERTAGKVMPRPSDDDTEGLDALYKQLGRPDEAAGYEFAEGTDEGTAAAFGALAHKHNLTVAQMKGLDEGMVTMLAERDDAMKIERTADLDTLKGEWGAAWTERSAIAEKVRATFLDFIPADGMSAATLAALHKLGAALGGEGSQLLDHKGGDPEPTKLEAREQIEALSSRIADLQKEHDGAKRDELKGLVLKRRALYKKAYPGGEIELGGRQQA